MPASHSWTVKHFANANWPAYGAMNAQVIISGDYYVLGIKSDRIPGADFAQKRSNVLRSTIDDLMIMAKDGWTDGQTD